MKDRMAGRSLPPTDDRALGARTRVRKLRRAARKTTFRRAGEHVRKASDVALAIGAAVEVLEWKY
jgi:hypothetical protein